MKRTMVTRVLGQLIVLRENNETPLDSEWDAFLKLLAENRDRFEHIKILVVTDGGGPDYAQRKRLDNTLLGKPVRVAVVTDSAKSRFIASAISLINKQHMGFAMKEMSQAYVHLGMTPAECREAESALPQMTAVIR
jgi:hypothetical protein